MTEPLKDSSHHGSDDDISSEEDLLPGRTSGSVSTDPFLASIAAILEAIPADNDGAASLSSICLRLGLDPEHYADALRAMLGLLAPFEVLEVDTDTTGEVTVKAATRRSALFIRSYAAYLREGKSILSDWSRGSNPDGPYFARETLSGPQFLYLIERQRSAGRPDALPLRVTRVSQIIIKAKVRGRAGVNYLMQFDPIAEQFQLIGGHRRPTDPDDRTTAVRELEEELSKNQFYIRDVHPHGRDELAHLGTHSIVSMSRALGVTTGYKFTFFQLKMPVSQIKLGPADRWITDRELSKGATSDGSLVAIDAFNILDKNLPGGVAALPLSLSQKQHRRISAILRDHRWELCGLIVGIIGIAVSVLLFMLSSG